MKKRLDLKYYLTMGLIVAMSSLSYSLPGPAGGSPPAGAAPAGTPPTGSPPAGGPPCWSPPCVPIDGGIGLLLAAGAFVGGRKIYKVSKESKTEE